MVLFRFKPGTTPLLVSMPHVGTHIPQDLLARMAPVAARLDDTDWHLERLYDFLDGLGASVLAATHSRYVIDLNRPPDNTNLYPGQDTTGFVPIDTFHREPLYATGEEPAQAETDARLERYWKPYHAKLREEMQMLKAKHGYALLWDAHSIFSVLPRFFAGTLTDFNFGTADGRSCGPGIGEAVLAQATGFSAVLNGRFKGGYITRTYGRPAEGVHAVQLELSEATYMDQTPPYAFREDLAARVRPVIRAAVETFLRLAPRP